MTDDEIEKYVDEEDVPAEFAEILRDTKVATEKINAVLKDYGVSVVMSALASATVQCICLTSTDLDHAIATTQNLGAFLEHSVNGADEQGMCAWNNTLQ